MEEYNFLVVDDSPTMRKIIIGQLNAAGYFNTGEAEDGLDALDSLETGDYTFVLTDWNMPNMDGLTLVKEIRSRPEFMTLPILVVTTRNTKNDVVQAIKAGANNFVVKPFGPETLKEKIDKIISALATF